MPIEERTFGPESPRLAVGHYNLGLALSEVPGKRRSARTHLERAARLFSGQENSAGLYPTLKALARLSRLEGKPEEG